MTMMSRRHLLISSSAVGLAALTRGAWAQTIDAPPVASVRPVSDHLHGTIVTDPYRWMENPADPEWEPYLMGQNGYARRVLGSLKARNELATHIDALTGTMERINAVQQAGRFIFVERRPATANTFKLYVREGLDGAERLLVDPDRQAVGSTHYSLDYWQASPDGRLVAFGTSPAGSEASVLRFIETATGRVLPDAIDGALWNTFSWSPDGSAIFVNRTKAGAKAGDVDRFLDSAVWRHYLGASLSTDTKIMARGLDPSVTMKDIGEPLVVAQAGQPTVLGIVENGVENELDVYVAQLSDAIAGRPQWATVCKVADGVTGVAMHLGDIYAISHNKAPHSRILKASVADPAIGKADVVLPEGRSVLKSISAARDALYVYATDTGLGQVMRLLPDGSVSRLRLPFPGTVFGLRTDPLQDGCWFSLESWVKPPVICYGRPDGTVLITDIAPQPPIDVTPYESQEVSVTVRDGAKVPLSIIYRKDVPRNGSAPMYLQAYGAYGLNMDPGFGASILPWLDLGGVVAVAHVRGGGELGQEWYKAGQLLTKPNTWRDCIDCAEYLIAEKWTSKAKLAVEGTSGGGIMVGRFLTERPDLLAVAVVRVGATNALRFEFEEAGPLNIPEFGTISDPVGFRALQEMDALSHVKNGVPYPAVLLTTGVTDPRVAPWEAGKMAARLQAATSSGKPVLLRVETDAGHGVGSTRKQIVDERADTFAFMLWQMGDRRFQPQ